MVDITAIIVAIIALLGTLVTAYLTLGKLSKADAVKLESRLTALEQNQFSADDRRCLHDLDTKMTTIWKFFERDLPAALTQPHTGRLDALLKEAKKGIGNMKVDDAKELFSLIKAEETECQETEEKSRSVRGLKLSMYRSFLEHEIAALNILI